MDMCLISVIVPVYNVAQFLEECLVSIINQSYKNLEIIMVDDGSTDESGIICDRYAVKDKRIKVIHKENGGLSSARNCGLDVAKGDFVVFVDSDDYLNYRMIEKLYGVVTAYKTEIGCCDYTSVEFNTNSSSGLEILNKKEAISTLFDDHGFQCFAWNKIYKYSLFENIRYPEGKLFEDITTTYKLIKKVDRISYLKEELYYYRKRANSITKAKFNKKNIDLIEAINFVYMDSISDGLISNRLKVGYLGYYLSYVQKAFTANYNIDIEYEDFAKKTRESIFMLFKEKNISLKKRIQLIIVGISPLIYKWICRDLRLIRK